MAYIRNLDNLTELRLLYTSVTDEGIKHLEYMTMLLYIELYDISMTDRGFQVFQNFSQLRALWGSGAEISNESLPLLRSMHSLRRLHLANTGISAEGLISLNYDMPNTEVTPLKQE